jgi:hypothetical protein
MSIFGKIVSAIFKHKSVAGTTAAVQPGATTAAGTPATGKPLTHEQDMIAKIVDKSERSIVDLMKLFKLDSSLSARR